jgi:hypothetical protein
MLPQLSELLGPKVRLSKACILLSWKEGRRLNRLKYLSSYLPRMMGSSAH